MTRSVVMAALVTLSVFAAACGQTTGTQSSSPPPANSATTPAAPTEPSTGYEPLCDGLTWPRPLPAVVGLLFRDTSGSNVQPLTCLDGVRGIRPDGSVVYEHNAYKPHTVDTYQITAVSPPPGTPVGPNVPVTVTLVALGPNEPHVYHPCDWVTNAEAEGFLGAPVGNGIEGSMENVMAQTDVYCPYKVDGKLQVMSELRMTGAHVVDAASEFAFRTAQDSIAVDGVGIKAACTTPRRRDRNLLRLFYVLLPGERIYIASGWRGVSCDTLRQFAQTAIPRIGA